MLEVNPKDGFYSMGNKTLRVPMALFAKNRSRLVEALTESPNLPKHSIVLLQGGGDQGICEGDSCDFGVVFRQEAYFQWAFGVLEPDYFGAIDVTTGKSVLFIPRLPQDYVIVMGTLPTFEHTKERSANETSNKQSG